MVRATGVVLFVVAVLVGTVAAAALELIAALAATKPPTAGFTPNVLLVGVLWLATLGGSVALAVCGRRFSAAFVAALPLAMLVGMFVYNDRVARQHYAGPGLVVTHSDTSEPTDGPPSAPAGHR